MNDYKSEIMNLAVNLQTALFDFIIDSGEIDGLRTSEQVLAAEDAYEYLSIMIHTEGIDDVAQEIENL